MGELQMKPRNVTYDTWYNMKRRCNDPTHARYKDYGERGISYDSSWEDYKTFLQDMGEKPIGLTLERRDNDKGYSKDNCCWASTTPQAFNKRKRVDNISGHRGVNFHRTRKKWRAYATINYKTVVLYYGPSYEAAVVARLTWERENVRLA